MRLIKALEDWLASRYVQQHAGLALEAGQLAERILRELDRQGLGLNAWQGLSFRRVALIGGRYLVAEIDTRNLPAATLKGLRGSMVLRGLRAALGQPVLLTHHQDWVEFAVDMGEPPRSKNWLGMWLKSLPLFLRKHWSAAALGAPATGATLHLEAEP